MIIKTQLSDLRRSADRFAGIEGTLTSCSAEIQSVQRALRRKIVAEAQFGSAFRDLLDTLDKEKRNVSALEKTLGSIITCYEKNENQCVTLLDAARADSGVNGAGAPGTGPLPAGSPGSDTSSAGTSGGAGSDPAVKFDDPSLLDGGKKDWPADLTLRVADVMLLLYTPGVSQEELERLARKLLPEMPSKNDHYSRNAMMPDDKLPKNAREAQEMGWNDNVASSCHQFTSPGRDNQKWVSPDGRYEVIFDSSGTRRVDADEDEGTYNFGDPSKDAYGHFVLDVIPWLIYGNSANDKTTFQERRDAFIRDGLKDTVDDKVEDFQEKVNDLKEQVWEEARRTGEKIREKAEDIKEGVQEKAEEIKENVQEKAEEIRENIEEGIDQAKDYVDEKVSEAKDYIDEKVSDAKEQYNDFKDTVDSYIDSIRGR